MSLKMTEDEREAFLAEPHVGVISIEDPGRGPLSTPIWYDYKPGVGLWVITSRTSRKGIALDKAGRFSVVAQAEEAPYYKYVSVEGPIVDVRPADREKDTRPMAHRYFGTQLGNAYVDSQSVEDAHVYMMQPQRWLTVDYAKIAAES
jgi:nitroimidazol reductase NimA-like FMN-containing flavoprotein (pyridoxamine 5'-phosphate oxidase superfamily)